MATGLEEHRQRLRERFQNSGFDGFHDHEVLEMVLCYALPRRDTKPVAKELLGKFKTLSSVFDAPSSALKEIGGVKDYAATFLTMIPRLLERYYKDRWKDYPTLDSTRKAVEHLSSILCTERVEVFCMLALNSQNGVLGLEETAVFPRLVVEAALRHRATAVILAHNHPGGDPNPSQADRVLTQKLKRILGELDIVVHDHIIIAGPACYSFSEHGGL
jgi:DNA repair protein RadC